MTDDEHLKAHFDRISQQNRDNRALEIDKLRRLAGSHAALVEALRTLTDGMDRAGCDGYGMPECPWCRSQASKRDEADDWDHVPTCELVQARALLAQLETTR